MHHQTFANEIHRYNVETWYISQHCYISGPIRFCSKICYVGGRLIAVMLLCDRPRRSLDFDSLRGAPPYADGATELPPQKFRCAAHHRIPTTEKNRHTTIMGRSCPGFVLHFVKGCGMLINVTTSIPVRGSPDSFGGKYFFLPPIVQRGGGAPRSESQIS